ncbi:hypothetical protein CV102_10385 [Natronococcus pandeyae]|uniref:Uncharacterized protein n=2 Tax=Natronococcus pandeyae TaxID=2055836 RepID=A0A8J8Q1X5_9EURY|nr:hypothetical protein CV102_10385 [Natronococcus pandeyae]
MTPILILLVVVWIGLAVFYLLFFYAIKEDSDRRTVSESRDLLEMVSWSDLSTENVPEQVTVRDDNVLIERPVALIVQDPHRTEKSERELTIYDPSLVVVEMDPVLLFENPSSITIIDPDVTLYTEPVDQLDSTPVLDEGRVESQRFCPSPETVRIRDPGSMFAKDIES